jgi:UDP-N-acetylmuramate dehydrogenase
MKYLRNEPLAKHTTFKIGGPARYFCAPKSIDELKEALRFAKKKRLKVSIIGAGSNLLIPDKGFDGLVINPQMSEVVVKGTNVIAGTGVPVQHLLNMLAKKGLSGLEFMTGIPGSVGGSIYMNAGTGKNEVGERVVRIWSLDKNQKFPPEADPPMEEKIKTQNECKFGYRKSIFQNGKSIITKAQFKLERAKPADIKAKIKALWKKRLAKQPYNMPSAGSVFKNPKGEYAGRIIEAAGLKGMRIGNAQISKKHANFIVNLGRAKADDVLKLIALVQKEVKKRFNINLKTEVKPQVALKLNS